MAVPSAAVSFMTANYVARELGYGAADEWGPFDAATNAAFQPIGTFPERFDALLAEIAGAGFDAIDLWFGHLNWRWSTVTTLLPRASLSTGATSGWPAWRGVSVRRPRKSKPPVASRMPSAST